jgi:hypothetical protein
MLSVVCWKWTDAKCRSKFGPEHVNVFRNMVERHYHDEHEVICITDDPTGIDKRVRCVPISSDLAHLENPLGAAYPSCYRRLSAFRDDFRDIVGDRFVSVDLDVVIVGDVTSIWNRKEDFVIWESPERAPAYNGSMWLVKTGSRPQVFKDFDPVRSPLTTKNAGQLGSDQGWLSYRIPGEAVWTVNDGVVSWKPQCRNRNWQLPPGARIVFFPGIENPWHDSARQKANWIIENYK